MECYKNDKARQRKLVKVILFYLLTFFNKKQWIDNNQTPKEFAVTDLTPEFIYCVNVAIKRGCFISQWLPGRRDLPVSMQYRRRDLLVSMLPDLQALANYTVDLSEGAGVLALDLFGCRRTRTTGTRCAPPVGQEYRHLNCL